MEKEQQSTTLDSNEWQTHESVESEQHHIGDGMAIAQELRAEGGSEEEGRSEVREGGNGGWAGEANEEGKGEELDDGKEEGEGSEKHEGEEREERREGSDEHKGEERNDERNEEERKEEERKEEEEREDSDKYDEGERRGEERGEGGLRSEEHTPISMVHAQYTASQADDESSKMWGDRTDDPLLQQGRNADEPRVEQELNIAQVPEGPHVTLDQHSQTDEQLLFSQEKREDGTTVSGEAAGGSRGVPEHIQQWRDEQQARMQQGGVPLPTHLAKENEGERTAQEQDVEAFDNGGREHRDSHAGEELKQEGHEQFPGQEREATGTSQDYLRSKDDGRGDIEGEREREDMVKEEEQGNMENLYLSQDTGQTPPPPLYDQSTHTDTLLPTPSTTYTPYPEVPPTSQSATHSVTASSSNFQEFDELSKTWSWMKWKMRRKKKMKMLK